jgi:hypothetical protein
MRETSVDFLSVYHKSTILARGNASWGLAFFGAACYDRSIERMPKEA